MEPLLDKLARQKIVRNLFATIRSCDRSSDRWMRFIIVAVCVTVAIFVTSFMIPGVGSVFGWVATITWYVLAWPVVVAGAFLYPYAEPAVWLLVGSILAGLFWAFIVELICKRRRVA